VPSATPRARVHARHVDAHGCRHLAVLGGGSHDATEARTREQPSHAGGDARAARDDDQVIGGHGERADAHLAVGEIDVAELMRRRAPHEANDVLEHQHEREREQELERLVAVVDRAQQPLDDRADGSQRQPRREEHRQEQRCRPS